MKIPRRILYIQYTNPAAYPPLEHSSKILAREGWRVLFLGISAKATNALRFSSHPNIVVRQIPSCRPGWRQKVHYLFFCLWSTVWVFRWRPQWIYASDPLSCPPGFVSRFIPGIKVLYHEHDSPNTADSQVEPSIFMRLIFWSRRRLALGAESCVLPNEHRLGKFMEEMEIKDREKIACVWNCPSREEIASHRVEKIDDILHVYYHGNLGPPLLPSAVLEAITFFEGKVHLRVVGYETIGALGYQNLLKECVSKLKIEGSVEFLDPMPRYGLWKVAHTCDVGLALVSLNQSNRNLQSLVGASNKVFDYLAAGLALLVSDSTEWKKTFVNPGYGLACDPEDPVSIKEALEWFINHPEETRAMGEKGRQRILQEWNYEKQFVPVLQKLDESCR